MKFVDLGFEAEVNDALATLGFQDCTPIQESSMPHIRYGKDVAGLAQTGTGKTAAFLLPLMDRILKAGKEGLESPDLAFSEWKKNQFILVLVPTRELAEQVFNNFLQLKGTTFLRAVKIYGGMPYDKQKEELAKGFEFLIATPGRLIDLYKEHVIDLRQVRAIVFDEADRMFDMGFKDDMTYILQRVPRERQFLVFSATLNFDVLNVAYQFGADPIECNIDRDQVKAENVDDKIFHIGREDKPGYLLSLLRHHQPRQVIVFSNFKMNVGRLAAFLSDNQQPALGISSLLTQAQRMRVMAQFKAENERNILVATDVAARGLDIKGVDMVINFELPDDPENYVHRIGRTGRAGEKGRAFSLVCDRDVEALGRIEEYLKHKLEIGWLEDENIVKEYAPFPKESFESRRPPQGRRDFKEGREERGGGRRDRPPRRRDGESARSEGSRPRNHEVRREGTEAQGQPREREPRRDQPRDHQRGENRSESRGGMHRDRLTGRHGSRDQRETNEGGQERGARNGRPENKQAKPGQRGGRRRDDRRNQPSRHHGAVRPAGVGAKPPTASVGQKISGFLKKLFS